MGLLQAARQPEKWSWFSLWTRFGWKLFGSHRQPGSVQTVLLGDLSFGLWRAAMGAPCLEPFQKTASYISHWTYAGNSVERFAIWTSGGRELVQKRRFQNIASYINHWTYAGNFVEWFVILTLGGRELAQNRPSWPTDKEQMNSGRMKPEQ